MLTRRRWCGYRLVTGAVTDLVTDEFVCFQGLTTKLPSYRSKRHFLRKKTNFWEIGKK